MVLPASPVMIVASRSRSARIRAAKANRTALRARGAARDQAPGPLLADVRAPVLLIVGGADTQVLALNEAILGDLPDGSDLVVIPGAGHLFAEPGAIDQVAALAAGWFARHVTG